MCLLPVAGFSIVLAACGGSGSSHEPAGGRQATKAMLPQMVVPDASLARLAGELPRKYAFFATAEDATASTTDPNDTAADMRRLGRIAGYVRGRNATGAFTPRAPKGLLAMGTSVLLWRDSRAAAASIDRAIAEGKRFRGKAVEGGVLMAVDVSDEPSLGPGAVLLRGHMRPTGGTDRFNTAVLFRVGSLRGNAVVVRSDGQSADRTALRLAEQLRRRMVAALRRQ